MRVLWFVDKPLPAVTERLGRPPIHHASWQSELEVLLRETEGIELAVASTTPQEFPLYQPFESSGVVYYALGSGAGAHGVRRVAARWRSLVRASEDIEQARRVIADFRPDVIHVHGTENAFGLLAACARQPVVVSIQGLLSICELMDPRGRDGSLLLSLSPWLFARGTGTVLDHVALRRAAERERLIIRQCRHIIGRTRWDADVVRVLNPAAHYYHSDEPLRREFSAVTWDIGLCEADTVYCTMGGYARKGMGTLLRAIALLRDGAAPAVRLRFAGLTLDHSEGGRATAREIRRLGLTECVANVGTAGPADLARELARARVFALPTHIDNGSNSLSEAMMVGTPAVASAAGGIPTTARDGVEALLVQDGDPYALAGAVARLLDDPGLSQRLSTNARAKALDRHNAQKLRDTVLDIYDDVLASARY